MTRDRAARRCGFTLMEVLTTMIVVGILAGLALPRLRAAIYRADASRIAADMTVVRTAIYQFREDNGNLPTTAAWGVMPPELAPYLNNVEFAYKDLDYRLVTTAEQGRVDFKVQYPEQSPIGVALLRFSNPGSESGSVVWTAWETRWRLLEDNG